MNKKSKPIAADHPLMKGDTAHLQKKSLTGIHNLPTVDELKMDLLEDKTDYVKTTIEQRLSIGKGKPDTIVNKSNFQFLKLLSEADKDLGNFKEAEKNTDNLITYLINEKIEDNDLIDAYILKATICRHKSRYNEAFTNLESAVKLLPKLDENTSLIKNAKLELNYSFLFYLLEFFDEALKRVNEAERLFEEAALKINGDKYAEKYIENGWLSCLHMKGKINTDDPTRHNALEFLNKANAITDLSYSNYQDGEKRVLKKINKIRLRGYILNDLAKFYLVSGATDTDKARELLDESKKIRYELHDKKGTANVLYYEGLLESKMANWQQAIERYREAEIIAAEIDALDIRINIYAGLFEANHQLAKYADAIIAVKNYQILKQREYEKRQENRVQLELLIPRATQNQLDEAGEVIKLAGLLLDNLLPDKAKMIKQINLKPEKIIDFNLHRNNFNSDLNLRIPAVKAGLRILIESLMEKDEKDRYLWSLENHNLKYLKPLWEVLTEKDLISKLDFELFKTILLNKDNKENQKIEWKGPNQLDLLMLCFHLFYKKLLHHDFTINTCSRITNKFSNSTTLPNHNLRISMVFHITQGNIERLNETINKNTKVDELKDYHGYDDKKINRERNQFIKMLTLVEDVIRMGDDAEFELQ